MHIFVDKFEDILSNLFYCKAQEKYIIEIKANRFWRYKIKYYCIVIIL